jgi:hypothetical protein
VPHLAEILPHFSVEVEVALVEAGFPALAESLGRVDIVERCRCEEPGCITFFALHARERPNPRDCERIVPNLRGVSCVLYHHGRVVWIEALGRPVERAILDERMPIVPSPNTSLERTREG